MPSVLLPGAVWLVGAGPGAGDLLTLRALRLIEAASVVFFDALVGDEVLAMVPPGVAQVAVGKRSGRHSLDQPSITDLIVHAALGGERVVRLKGGDPSIFGRSAEELAALRAAGLTVGVCPGVTAASAGAAAAGASLTLRGIARRLTLLTAHVADGTVAGHDWARLADAEATLAIYMGKAAAGGVAAELVAAGLSSDTPCLLVESASLPGERVWRSELGGLRAAAGDAGEGPLLILIGRALEQGLS